MSGITNECLVLTSFPIGNNIVKCDWALELNALYKLECHCWELNWDYLLICDIEWYSESHVYICSCWIYMLNSGGKMLSRWPAKGQAIWVADCGRYSIWWDCGRSDHLTIHHMHSISEYHRVSCIYRLSMVSRTGRNKTPNLLWNAQSQLSQPKGPKYYEPPADPLWLLQRIYMGFRFLLPS